MRLSEAIDDYASAQQVRGDSLSHRKECVRILASLLAHLGDRGVSDVEASELRDFLAGVRRRPGRNGRRVSDHTVLAYHRTLQAFFNYLSREGFLPTNPMLRVPKPKTPQELVRPFSDEQVRRLISQPDPASFTGVRDITLMVLMLDTGCRISECLGLRLGDVDLEQRIFRVMGKGRKERFVPFGERLATWLERYLERRRSSVVSDYLFINQYGERLLRTSVAQRLTAYGKQAGIEGVRVSPHTFRHTFGVLWLVGGGEYKGDTLSLQRILGHSTPAMTQKYVNFANEDLRKLHARLSPADRLVDPPPDGRRRRLK